MVDLGYIWDPWEDKSWNCQSGRLSNTDVDLPWEDPWEDLSQDKTVSQDKTDCLLDLDIMPF